MTLIDETVEAPAPRRPWGLIVAGLVVLAAVIAGGVYFVATGDDSEGDGDGREPSTNVLPTGEASVDLSTSTSSVAGFPRGFPQTEAGAVEAYLAWATAPSEAVQQPDEVLKEYYADVMPPEVAAAEAADIFDGRETVGLDETGQFMGEPGTQPYYDCLPEYGAYRSEARSDTEVEVELWMPCIVGVGSPSDTSELFVWWSQTPGLMQWRDGDWRMDEVSEGTEAPTPANKEKVNVSFIERAQILGDGWEMFDGASQVWPVELLGEEPQ